MSDVRCRCQMSDVRCQMSDVRMLDVRMLDVRCQMLDPTERIIWQSDPAVGASVGCLVTQWLGHQERPETFTVQSFLHLSDRLQTQKGIKQTIYSDNRSSSSGHSYSALPWRHSLEQTNIKQILILLRLTFPSPVGPIHIVAATGLS